MRMIVDGWSMRMIILDVMRKMIRRRGTKKLNDSNKCKMQKVEGIKSTT